MRCPIKSSGLRISSILSTAALAAPSLHLPQAALGLATKFELASPVQTACTYKKSAIPDGMTDFLELLARFELATSSLPSIQDVG